VTQPVLIDGSLGEGGGQILRTSLALSALTGKPFEMIRIRANRTKPGLRPQHCQAVSAAAGICNGKAAGNLTGSTSITFEPGAVEAGSYRYDIGTAGSTSLVLQTIYLPLLLATRRPSTVTICGGTHVPFAPCFHYLDLQWRKYLERIDLRVGLQMESAGYYPKGGGTVRASIHPTGRPLGAAPARRRRPDRRAPCRPDRAAARPCRKPVVVHHAQGHFAPADQHRGDPPVPARPDRSARQPGLRRPRDGRAVTGRRRHLHKPARASW